MVTKYFRCKLLSDVVVNASLATEGNMQSLDYIPGSNFLGIAAKNYGNFGKDAYEIFHSGKVSFGDAFIAKEDVVSHATPFSLYTGKLKSDITKDYVWVHHAIFNKEITDENGNKIQLKQVRGSYFNKKNDYFKTVKKEFYLKSAYDPKERRSKESAMFGFEAIKKGQEFIFSVLFEDETYVNDITNALNGIQHIGKSKTAEYGLVEIKEITKQVETFESKQAQNKELVIYAQSNLCFVNKYGQFTLQPGVKDFGVSGEILWEKCQIRTYSYSPWNTKRNTTSTQRDVILKGSVIVIKLDKDTDVASLPVQVGEYNAEGLGRVIYNPEFLEYENDGTWVLIKKLIPIKDEEKEIQAVAIESNLGKLLHGKKEFAEKDKKIGKAVLNELKNNPLKNDNRITNTQWGLIRKVATLADDMDTLMLDLFGIRMSNGEVQEICHQIDNLLINGEYVFPKLNDLLKKGDESGILMHGVADERIWGKNNNKRKKELLNLIYKNKGFGTKFVIKFASEIAKKNNNG